MGYSKFNAWGGAGVGATSVDLYLIQGGGRVERLIIALCYGNRDKLRNRVNSRLADTPLLRTLAIKDKIQIPIYRGLTENDSRYYELSL